MNSAALLDKSWGILMVVLFFGGSIFVHELGHFLAAKWRGLHIERFSIGFGPKIVAWRRKGIEYRLAWLPFGGYVLLPQLADMQGVEGNSSVDVEALPKISYKDRVIVLVAGALFNIIFAFILASILFFTGRPSNAELASVEIGHVSQTLENRDGQEVTAPAYEAGLQKGDIIRQIDGRPMRHWENIQEAIALSSGIDADGKRVIHFTIEREGNTLEIPVYPIISERNEIRQVGIASGFTTYVSGIFPDSPADKAGIKSGDILLSFDGIASRSRGSLSSYVQDKPDTPINLVLERDGAQYEAQVTPITKQITRGGETRVMTGIYSLVPAPDLIRLTPWEQLKQVFASSVRTIKALAHFNSDIGIKQMGGPVDIGRVIFNLAQYDFLNTLWFVLVINISLAVFNLLPIPVLDGGHILFATISKIRSKPINPNLIASVQGTFMLILFGLMATITYFGISRWNRDAAEQRQFEEDFLPITFSETDTSDQTD